MARPRKQAATEEVATPAFVADSAKETPAPAQPANAELNAALVESIATLQTCVSDLYNKVNFIAQFLNIAVPANARGTRVDGDAGQRELAGDPRRTETGMGAILSKNSTFL